MAPKERMETVAGCRVKLMRKGHGEPLLFLHGAAGAGTVAALHGNAGRAVRRDRARASWLWQFGNTRMARHYWRSGLSSISISSSSSTLTPCTSSARRSADGSRPSSPPRTSSRLKTLTLVAPAGIHVKGVQARRHVHGVSPRGNRTEPLPQPGDRQRRPQPAQR